MIVQKNPHQWLVWMSWGMVCLGAGCSNEQPRIDSKEIHAYGLSPPRVQKKIDQTCQRIGITHFVIKNQKLLLKKKALAKQSLYPITIPSCRMGITPVLKNPKLLPI